MSLINDALKRAKQAQQRPAPPPAGAPLRPAAPAPSVPSPRSLWLPIVAAALLVFVGGVLIVVALTRGFGLESGAPVASKAELVAPQNQPATPASRTASASPAIEVSTPTVVVQAMPAHPPSPGAVIAPAVPVERSNAVPLVTAPTEPPLPRLQGIVFNPVRPTAFLNGKSVVVGGRAGEYTVLAITKLAVTVERAGQTNVLAMEE